MNIDVYIIHTSLIKDNFALVSSFVDAARKEKAERYVNEKDKSLSYGAEYLVSKYLPKKEMKETLNTKQDFNNGINCQSI